MICTRLRLGHVSVPVGRQFAAQWGDCKKSWIAPVSAIVIIIIIIIIIITIISQLLCVTSTSVAFTSHCKVSCLWVSHASFPFAVSQLLCVTSISISFTTFFAATIERVGHGCFWEMLLNQTSNAAVPSYHVACNTTCCMWYALDMLQVICTQLHLGHLSVRVGDSSQHSEESKKSWIAPLNAVIIIMCWNYFSGDAMEWVMVVACGLAGLFLLCLGHLYLRTGTNVHCYFIPKLFLLHPRGPPRWPSG